MNNLVFSETKLGFPGYKTRMFLVEKEGFPGYKTRFFLIEYQGFLGTNLGSPG